eukprot:tig00000605_g2507.t1
MRSLQTLEAVVPGAALAGGKPRALAVFATADAARAAAALLPASVACSCTAVLLGELAPVQTRAAGPSKQPAPTPRPKNSKKRTKQGRYSLREFLSIPLPAAGREDPGGSSRESNIGAGVRSDVDDRHPELEAPEIQVESTEAQPSLELAPCVSPWRSPAGRPGSPRPAERPAALPAAASGTDADADAEEAALLEALLQW